MFPNKSQLPLVVQTDSPAHKVILFVEVMLLLLK